MKKYLLFTLFVISLNFLSSETMLIHTQTGDYEFDLSDIEQIRFEGDVAVEEIVELLEKIPLKFLKNYPNPFTHSTTISLGLNTDNTEVTEISIYNIKGQKIRTFANEQISKSPNQQIIWDGKDDSGAKVSSGIYFYKLTIPNAEPVTRKMVLLK